MLGGIAVDHAEQPVEHVGVLVARLADPAEVNLFLVGRLVHEPPPLRRCREPRWPNLEHSSDGHQQLSAHPAWYLLGAEKLPRGVPTASRLVEDRLPPLGRSFLDAFSHRRQSSPTKRTPCGLASSRMRQEERCRYKVAAGRLLSVHRRPPRGPGELADKLTAIGVPKRCRTSSEGSSSTLSMYHPAKWRRGEIEAATVSDAWAVPSGNDRRLTVRRPAGLPT